MAAMVGGFFHCMDFREILQFFSYKTACQILKLFHRIVPWVTLFKNSSRNFDQLNNMAAVRGRLFALCGLQRNSSLMKSLVRF